MTNRLIAATLVLLLATTAIYAQKKGSTYGATPAKPSATAVTMTQAVAKKMYDSTIVMTGRVVDVCKKKGCWMMITDRQEKARVTFKDYGFFVPTKLRGKLVRLEGVLTMSELSEDDARHYAEDAGKSKQHIRRIKGPQREMSFEATSVTVLR